MKEPARLERNRQRLTECFPTFGAAVRRTLDSLEAQGFRPRIQDAWRSQADQLIAFNTGKSETKFGFHNVTGAGGVKESLACDILDDNNPLGPPTRYLLALALAARAQGLETLILMRLSQPLIAGVEAALASGDIDRPVKVGFDPTHVQPRGLTIAQAKNGARPGGSVTPSADRRSSVRGGGGPRIHVVQPRDTLGKIARMHGTTVARLLELNPQFIPNPNLIHVGDQIRLP